MSVIDIVHASSAVAGAPRRAPDGIAASFGLDVYLFLFQLANFAIVAVILWFLVLKPLSKKLAERQKLIDESLDNAKKIQDGLARSESDYKKRMQAARVEAEKILDKAADEAGKLSVELKAKAKQEIEALVTQAKHTVQAEKEEMITAFRGQAADLVVLALEKILEEKMTGEKDTKMIAEILGKFKA